MGKNVLNQRFIVQKKNRSLFMLQIIIFYNLSTEYRKKPKGFYKKGFLALEMRHTTRQLNPWLKSSKFGYNFFHLAKVLATKIFEPG